MGKACTGLLFMKPTDAVKEMVELWAREIVETNAREGQVSIDEIKYPSKRRSMNPCPKATSYSIPTEVPAALVWPVGLA